METLYILIGVLLSLLTILSLLYNYKKYRREMEAKLDTIKLLIGSVKDHHDHDHKIAMDLIQLNKLEMERVKHLQEQLNNATEQKMEEFSKSIEEQISLVTEFKDRLQNDFITFQKVINPQFLQSNKSASELALILKDQVQHTVDALTKQLNHAKSELEKVQAFQLLRTKDSKEQQVNEHVLKVKEVESRFTLYKKQLDSLASITEFWDRNTKDDEEYELGEV